MSALAVAAGRLSIRVRLLVTCAGLALLTGVVGALAMWAFWTMNATLQAAVIQGLPAVTQLLQADGDIQAAVIAERSLMLLKGDAPEARAQVAAHGEHLSRLSERWKSYTGMPAPEAERAQWPTFEAAHRE